MTSYERHGAQGTTCGQTCARSLCGSARLGTSRSTQLAPALSRPGLVLAVQLCKTLQICSLTSSAISCRSGGRRPRAVCLQALMLCSRLAPSSIPLAARQFPLYAAVAHPGSQHQQHSTDQLGNSLLQVAVANPGRPDYAHLALAAGSLVDRMLAWAGDIPVELRERCTAVAARGGPASPPEGGSASVAADDA